MNATQEEWRPVVGWEGKYEVSSHGRVRSIDRTVEKLDGTTARYKGRMLKLYRSPKHYYRVALPKHGGGQEWACVHKLVLEAFVGPRPPGYVACHGDGDYCNNHVQNLRWDTYSANVQDALAHGTHSFAARDKCLRDHPFDAVNTRVDKRGHRFCRQCQRDRNARYRAEKRSTK